MRVDSRGRPEYVMIAAMAVLWGSVGIFVRWVDLAGREQIIVFMRSILSLVFLVGVIYAGKREVQLRPGKHPVLLLASGAILTFHWVLFFKAINTLSLGDAVFITYLAPVFVALLAPFTLEEKLERATVIALTLALTGMVLISLTGREAGENAFNSVGLVYALLAAITYAVLVIILKKLRSDTPTLTINIYQTAVIVVLLLPFTAFRDLSIKPRGWISLLVLGVLLTGATGIVYVYSVRKVKAQHVGILTYLEPVSAMVFGFIFLAEKPGWQDLLGGLLIVAAGVAVLWRGMEGVSAPEVKGRVLPPSRAGHGDN
jgi:RarD protein